MQDGVLYVMGGTRGERLRSVERMDLRAGKWEVLPVDMIETRSAGAACSVGGRVYVLGGIDNNQQVGGFT